MDDVRLGSLFRAARIRRGWRQVDVARRAGVGQVTVSRIERGELGACTVDMLRRVAAVLEIRLDIAGRWRGADGDRLLSARHSMLADETTRQLTGLMWQVRPEVSFSVYGERGLIDLLAWHPMSRALLVIELKTELVDVGELIGTLDRKRRLAWGLARDMGWEAAVVSACVLLLETRSNRRGVAAHAAVLRAALPADGRTLRAWLRNPDHAIAALAFLPISRVMAGRPVSRCVKRVRRRPSIRERVNRSTNERGR